MVIGSMLRPLPLARLAAGLDLGERGGKLRLVAPARSRPLGLDPGLHGRGGGLRRVGRQEAHLALERHHVLVGAVRPLEVLELVGQAVAGVLLGQLGPRLGLGLDLVDLGRHPVERLERALIAQAAHRVLDGALRLRALLARDEDVLLALCLLDLVVQKAQRLLQLLDRGALLGPLVLVRGGQLVVLTLPRERLLREPLVARAQGHHRLALPLLRIGLLLLELLGEALLVGDGRRDLLFGLYALVAHLEHHLLEHLLAVLPAADQVVEVALYELRQSAEDAHRRSFSSRSPRGAPGPGAAAPARGRSRPSSLRARYSRGSRARARSRGLRDLGPRRSSRARAPAR